MEQGQNRRRVSWLHLMLFLLPICFCAWGMADFQKVNFYAKLEKIGKGQHRISFGKDFSEHRVVASDLLENIKVEKKPGTDIYSLEMGAPQFFSIMANKESKIE